MSKRSAQAEHHSAVKRRTLQVDSEEAGTSRPSTFDATSVLTDTYNYSNCQVAGQVEKLQMTNFMCHSNLEISFNQRINFVTGRNGSGKSAVMAALIVALGGSANLTGRGSGVADFIKKGEHTGKVSITLFNEGINAYRKSTYGSRITIVRTFSRTSGNSYAIKSEHGHAISKKKEEVDRICTALNLQIKNPVCILNQDVARSFLGSTDSSFRYDMFEKSTQLKDIFQIHANTFELLCKIEKDLDGKADRMKTAEREVAELKQKLEELIAVEKHTKEKFRLENEFCWSVVCAEERKLETLKNRESELDRKQADMIKNESSYDDVMSDLAKEIKKLERTVQTLEDKRKSKQESKDEIQRNIQTFQRQLDNAEMQLRQLSNKSERQIFDINGIKEHISQNDDTETQSKLEQEQAAERMRILSEELELVRQQMTTAQQGADSARESASQKNFALQSARSELSELEEKKRHCQVQLEGLKSRGDMSMLKFGNYVPRLLEAIDDAMNRNLFQKKPIGPIGAHVSLTGDPKWAVAVETVMGALMTSFCCDNQKDFQVLSKIMDRVLGNNRQPSIIIGKFQPSRHDVSSRKVSVRGLVSVLDTIGFNNDVAYNTFIDQVNIETVLLFETDKQAASLLSYVQNVPRNCRLGVTREGSQYYPAPNYRSYSNRNSEVKFFSAQSDKKGLKDKFDVEIRNTSRAIEEKKKEIQDMKRSLDQVTDLCKRNEVNLKQLRQRQREIELEMNQLRDVEVSAPMLATKVALEEELQDLEKKYAETEDRMALCKKQMETLKAKKMECEGKLDGIGIDDQSLANEITAHEEQLEEKRYFLNQQKQKKQGASTRLAEITAHLRRVTDEIKNSQKLVEEKTAEAVTICPERVDTDREPLNIKKEMDRIERYLKKANQAVGSREGVIEEYKTKKSSFKSMTKSLNLLREAMTNVARFTVISREKIVNLRSWNANLVDLCFKATLKSRNYDGHLNFDFTGKTLELEVTPRDDSTRKDSKTLSGGERSYSTVAFILSVWRVVHMPFYFLDEFDVFMDKLNRKVIMDLLIQYAEGKSNSQFVFITPLDISHIAQSDIISVYKMPDPERRTN